MFTVGLKTQSWIYYEHKGIAFTEISATYKDLARLIYDKVLPYVHKVSSVVCMNPWIPKYIYQKLMPSAIEEDKVIEWLHCLE